MCVFYVCFFVCARAYDKKKNTKAEVYFFKVFRMHSTNANSDLSYPILLNTRSRKKKSLKIFFRNFGKKSEREQYYDASVARTLFFHNLNQVCTMHIRNTKYMRPCTYALCAMNVARPPMLRLHNVHAYCCWYCRCISKLRNHIFTSCVYSVRHALRSHMKFMLCQNPCIVRQTTLESPS